MSILRVVKAGLEKLSQIQSLRAIKAYFSV